MFIGHLLIGSIAGFFAAIVALIAGQSLLTLVAAYFITALLTVGAAIAICAWKHAVCHSDPKRGIVAALND